MDMCFSGKSVEYLLEVKGIIHSVLFSCCPIYPFSNENKYEHLYSVNNFHSKSYCLGEKVEIIYPSKIDHIVQFLVSMLE